MTTTTISDEQKQNAAEALRAVRAFHKAQDTWNRLNWIKAPGELRQPAWADLGTTRKAMYDALLLDFGKQTQKLSGSMTALLIGCRSQFIDRKGLSYNDQCIFTEALRGMEAELRKIAGIKERSFAELIAEKVVQKQDAKATAHDGTEIKMPARWFDKRTGGVLTADQLSKAYRAGRITGEKRSGRNYYTVDSVIAVYPEHARSLKPEKH